MSAIKDIMDLVTQLRNSVQDRKFAAEITQIQSLVSAVQLENSSTISENLDLKTENFELKNENSILGQRISDLEKRKSEIVATHTVEISELKGTQDCQ